jgi:DNA-nicking Smr family endonuclease
VAKKGFNTPFAGITKKVKIAENRPLKTNTNTTVKKEASEERLFDEEMLGVEKLAPDPRGRLGAPPPPSRAPGSRRAQEDAEVHAALADLVDGTGRFDVSDSDEYIEGIAEGIDRRLLKKLRKGDYAVQAHIDLHGMTAEEARGEVERFVFETVREGKRCVLIVHGRGLHSKDSIPVLKERLKTWLSRGRISQSVLAFSTARPADGGAGAIYVLLRR